jgi:DNA polymerase bacteriophage-type
LFDRLWFDIETYSKVDLRKATPYAYSEDPDFEILMASWSVDGERVHDVVGHDRVINTLADLVADPDVTKVAHNAAFERICMSAALGLPVGTYLGPSSWHDTLAVAGCLGYPQSLAKLAVALGAEPKDEAGTLLINWFCKPDRKGTRRRGEDHPERWEAFCRYCHQDVRTLIDVDRALGDFPTATERAVYLADQLINDTGMKIDVPMVRAAIQAADLNRMEQELELSGITGLAKPNNPNTLRAWFAEHDVPMDDMKAETVEAKLAELDALGETSSPRRRALELRQELALTASKKFVAALDSVSADDRLRGSFRYFGAHTGRWSGRGAQPQNLPRHAFDNEADTELAIGELMAGERVPADDLKRMVRPMFLGPLTVVDYSSIEARVIAWLANEEWALEAFRAGRDIYVETAERMSTPSRKLNRSQGKVAVLALGYAGGAGSLRNMGAQGSDHELEMLKIQWREANSNIVMLWHALEAHLRRYIKDRHWRRYPLDPARVRTAEIGSPGEPDHAYQLVLPSGRALTYRQPRWDDRLNRTGSGQPGDYRHKELSFDDPRRGWRERTYGGKLTENITQAVARDVMAEALVRLTDAGFRVVGHVHDEILVEGHHKDEVERIMTQVPSWAEGLPIDGEGFVCNRYRKG